MLMIRWIILFIIAVQVSVFPLDGLINAQFSVGDTEDGTFEGFYSVVFEIYTSTKNIELDDQNNTKEHRLWFEEHDLYISEGTLIKTLGESKDLDYHIFKSPELFIRLTFKDLEDSVYVPLISVPASIYAEYSDYAREIEWTESWMKISTPDQRVGIGITQNLQYELTIRDTDGDNIGTVNANHVYADKMFSPDGFEIYQLDYRKLVDIDDYSLHPDDGDGIPYDSPDVVYITPETNVGIGIYVTADITSQLHVSGDVKIDYGKLYGDQSNIELIGTANVGVVGSTGPQFIWDSSKTFLWAGFSSSALDIQNDYGDFSVVFGKDNLVGGDYSVSFGTLNTIYSDSSFTSGMHNTLNVTAIYSSITSGYGNKISDSINQETNRGYSVIAGGLTNTINGGWSGILGGKSNIVNGNYNGIIGGEDNTISSTLANYSTILGGSENDIQQSSYSVVSGYRAHVLDNHNGVFIFSGYDSSNSDDPYITSSAESQFLVYAKNGFGVGTNDVSSEQADAITLQDLTEPLDLKDHSLRVAGDIISIDDDGIYGYLIGDGRYITNIQSLWNSNESSNYSDASYVVYTETHVVGIGLGSDETPGAGNRPEAFIHLQDMGISNFLNFTDFKAFKIESNDQSEYMTLHLNPVSNASELDFSKTLEFQYEGTPLLEMSDSVATLNTPLVINYSGPGESLIVTGDVNISDMIYGNTADFSGTVTANVFSGSGANLTDVQVYYISDESGETYFQRVYVDSNGNVNIGTATENAAQLLHLGDDSNKPQLRLEDRSANSVGNYSTFQSTTQLATVFNGYQTQSDVVFSFGSNQDNTGGGQVKTLMQISATGNVSIGPISPSSGDRLLVSGNVEAVTFEGNGQAITGEQLDVPQTNDVTFTARVVLEESLVLTPFTDDDGFCQVENLGAIYSKLTDNEDGTAYLCVCVGPGVTQLLAKPDTASGTVGSNCPETSI